MKNISLFFVIAFFLVSCSKEAGEGGTSVIEGKVYRILTFDDGAGEIDTIYGPLPDEGVDVYIIYSDDKDAVYDDKFETDWNGKYRFEYLRKGDYTLYTYKDSIDEYDNNNPNAPLVEYDVPVFRQITISSNGSTNTVEDFVIEED